MELPVLNACNRCTALCCRYVAVEIDEPEDEQDFDNLRWYVSHENVQVYEDVEGGWYIQFFARCRHLGPHNVCTIWPNHYEICKEYEVRKCEFTLGQGGERHLFRTAEEVDRYVASRAASRGRKRTPSPRKATHAKGRPSKNGRPARTARTA